MICFFYDILLLGDNMEEKYLKLHALTLRNEEILRDKECVCIYCKKDFNYKDIVDFIGDSDGLTAECPYCHIDSVLPKEYDGYVVTKEDLDYLYEFYF